MQEVLRSKTEMKKVEKEVAVARAYFDE